MKNAPGYAPIAAIAAIVAVNAAPATATVAAAATYVRLADYVKIATARDYAVADYAILVFLLYHIATLVTGVPLAAVAAAVTRTSAATVAGERVGDAKAVKIATAKNYAIAASA